MEFIQSTVENHIGFINFNRVQRLNAFNTQMYEEFCKTLRQHEANAQVKVIFLSGEGKDFCSGNDVASFLPGETIEPEVLADRQQTASTDIGYLLAEVQKPLVAAVQGRAIGFGATMLLHCDFVFAAEDACLMYPFVKIGIVPEVGSSQLLVQRLGYLKAANIILQGASIPAKEARALSLISDVISSPELHSSALKVASDLAKLPSHSMLNCKRLLRRDTEPLQARINEEFLTLARQLNSRETQLIMKQLLA